VSENKNTLFDNLLRNEDRLDDMVKDIIECWNDLLTDHPNDVRKGAVKKLSTLMSEKSKVFHDKHQDQGVVKWNDGQYGKYQSLIIDIDSTSHFLYPYHIIRYSGRKKNFMENVIKSLEELPGKISINDFVLTFFDISKNGYASCINELTAFLKTTADPPLKFFLKCWKKLLREHENEIENFSLRSMQDVMQDMVEEFERDHAELVKKDYSSCKRCGEVIGWKDILCNRCGTTNKKITIEWNRLYLERFYSVYLRSENGIPFLFPFDIFRFSSFNGFLEKLCSELKLFSAGKEKLTLSYLIDRINAISNKSMAKLTDKDLLLIKEMTSVELTGKAGEDFDTVWKVTRGKKSKSTRQAKLRNMGVLRHKANVNYCAMGLACYLVITGEPEITRSLTDYTYMTIKCDSSKQMTVIFVPEEDKEGIASLKKIADVTSLVKHGSSYNFEMFEGNEWKFNMNEHFLRTRDRKPEMTFAVFEPVPAVEKITGKLVDVTACIAAMEFLEIPDLAKMTGLSESAVEYQIEEKIKPYSIARPQVVVKHVGLPLVYHVLVENGRKELVNVMSHLPKVSMYQFEKYTLFILYLPERELYSVERFLNSQEKGKELFTRGTLKTGENFSFKKLDFNRIWVKKKQKWKRMSEIG